MTVSETVDYREHKCGSSFDTILLGENCRTRTTTLKLPSEGRS